MTKSSSRDSCVPWTLDGIFLGARKPARVTKIYFSPLRAENFPSYPCAPFGVGAGMEFSSTQSWVERGRKTEPPPIPCSVAPPSVSKSQGFRSIIGIPVNQPYQPHSLLSFPQLGRGNIETVQILSIGRSWERLRKPLSTLSRKQTGKKKVHFVLHPEILRWILE